MLVGLGGSYKSIMPNRYYNDGTMDHVNHKVLSTPAAMVYGVYTSGKLSVKAKALLGQNLTEQTMIGGYTITTDNKYIPYTTMSSYISLNYGRTHQVGLMIGYTSNLGPSQKLPLESNYFGFGVDKANTPNEKIVGNIFRITPSYSYNINNWQLGVELEYTKAGWGERSAINGKIENLKMADNYRIYAILMYTF